MILLFDSKASKSTASTKGSKVRNNPVENSGILAMNMNDAKSLLTMGEYDTYVSSNPVAVDYSMYSNSSDYSENTSDTGFMSDFSNAVATMTDGGFGGFSAGSDCGASSGSFASVC